MEVWSNGVCTGGVGDEAGEAVQDLKGRREFRATIRKLDFKRQRVSHCSVETESRNSRSFWWRERARTPSWAKCLAPEHVGT